MSADYGADPVWDMSPGEGGMLDLDSLNLSEPLRKSLRKWAEEYDAHGLCDTSWTGRRGWSEQGLHLARRLAEELGPGTMVTYVDGGEEVLVRTA